jgi:hypothetical protein
MTEQERAELKAELMQEIKAELSAKRNGGSASKVLQPVYDKWCNGENRHGSHGKPGPLIEALPNYKGWQTWDYIRRLTCNIMRVSYVRDIKDVNKARKVAEKLCEVITQLAREVQ